MAAEPLRLIRATPDNHLLDKLRDNWDRQLLESEDSPQDYYAMTMQHAASIARERPQDGKYGVFILIEEQQGVPQEFEGLVHINHAWPRTKGATLRLVWNIIAPRYQLMDDVPEEQLARIKAAFVTEAMSICRNEMPSHELKVYLGNAIDRQFAVNAVSFMEDKYPDAKIAVRGSWLHMVIKGWSIGYE